MSEGHQYRISLCVDKSMFQLLDQSNSQVECYLVNKFLNKCLGTFSLASELASHSSHTRRYYPNTTHIGATNSSSNFRNSNNITPNVNLFATTLPTPHSQPQTSFSILDNYYRQQPSRKRAVPVRRTFTAMPINSEAKRPKASTVHHFPKCAALSKSDNQNSLNLTSESSDTCHQDINDDAFVEDLALDLSTSHSSPVKNECVQDDHQTEIMEVPSHAGRLNSEEEDPVNGDIISNGNSRCMRPLNLADDHIDEISAEFSPKNSTSNLQCHANNHPAHATSQSEPCSPVLGTLGDRDKRISVTEFMVEQEDNETFVAEETPFDLSRTNFNLSRSSFGSSSDDLDETSNPINACDSANQITNLSKSNSDAFSARQRQNQTFGPKFLSRSLDSTTNILSYSNGIDVKTCEKNNFASNTSMNRFSQALGKEGTSCPLSAFKRENVSSAHSGQYEDTKLFGSPKDRNGGNENSSFILNYKSELMQAEFAEVS